MERRDVLKGMVATSLIVTTGVSAQSTDGTPLQFAPKTPPDPSPLENELQKYPTCPYCGMDRAEYHYSRYLVHYEDDLADPTCSIHCAAISLALNMDRGPKAIYAADYGSAEKIKPLVNVDKATYLIGSNIKGVMTIRSKLAFANADAARKTRQAQKGKLGSFDDALTAAYADMAKDTIAIRKRRAERRSRQQKS